MGYRFTLSRRNKNNAALREVVNYFSNTARCDSRPHRTSALALPLLLSQGITKLKMIDFIKYLARIAPENETVLIVRQKPFIPEEYHADGALKCTWPAFLPSKTIKPDWAIYGNTAMFILDRFKDGKVSASAINCERVGFLVLDDIGTKSKLPPIEPTWKIETSPNNYQWGYTFRLDDQPLKGDFTAAIKVIAAAGYTDPGMTNPVRNFRLPGSVNLKPGKNLFAAKLTEFHPELEFSLSEICDAMGVTPETADTAQIRAIGLDDDGLDDVLQWLQLESKVLEPVNAEGWYGVECPNHEMHSDGNPTGRYLPKNRAYTCFHSSCPDWDSKRFLSWVEAEGGPKHEHGLREELLAKIMAGTLDKLTPTDAFPDVAKTLLAEVERRELGRVEKTGWYDRFAYLQDDDSYFDLHDRRELSRGTFNAVFRHISCKSIHGKNPKIEASTCYDENRQAAGATSLVGVTFAAGESVLVAQNGLMYGNRWRDARPTPVPGDASLWLAHVARMVPVAFEREHLLNMLAHKLQFPAIKINHALLLGGNHGSGKDSLLAPFLWSIGKNNVQLVKNEELTSQWGYALESEVMIVNELRQPEAKDRRAIENHLKPIIAAPPDMLPVNRKGRHPYQALNRVLVIAYSNERVAISIPGEDRRWFVLWSESPRLPEAEAVRLWNWYANMSGNAIVAAWLMARDVSAFNPAAAPPMTEAKQIMIEHGMSGAESFLVDHMRRGVGEFTGGVIGSPFHALCDRLQAQAPGSIKLVQPAVMHALREAGWVDCGRLASAEFQS